MSEPAGVPPPPRGLQGGIFLASLGVLVLQIALTRLMSVVLWYHFAFVAISLAMLGLALSGIALYLWPRLLERTTSLLPTYCRGAALSTVGALAYMLNVEPDASGGDIFSPGIVALYLVLLVPFTFAGLAVSATLAYHAVNIGRLYARDLLGAAVGCVIAVPLLDTLGAPDTTIFAGVCFAAAAACYRRPSGIAVDAVLLLVVAAVIPLNLATRVFEPVAMHGIADEDVAAGRTLDFAGWNSHSRIVVSRVDDWAKSINIDGHATTGIYRFDRQVDRTAVREQLPWMPLRAGSMPYVVLGERPEAMVIGPGGGLDLLNGIYYGARITAIELNGLIHGLMSDSDIGRWAGDPYHAPDVQVIHDEARSWLRRSDRTFDLIQASMIDTWAATAGGAFSLAENSLYTVEAFVDYHEHLTDRGIVHFMRWNEQPPRQSLRVLALIAEASHRVGVDDLDSHLVVLEEPQFPIAGVPMASVIWSKRPLTAEALQRLDAAIVERQKIGPVRVLCWPGRELDNELSRFVRTADRAAFLAGYTFDVSPTTDDRPFFFQTARFRDIVTGGPSAENEDAVAVLTSVMITVTVIVLLAFVLPLLFSLRRIGAGNLGRTTAAIAWFCCLGVGFMLAEIPLLQRFSLYIGHPAWTLSCVVGSLLLGAGAGGMRVADVTGDAVPRALRFALLRIVVALLLMLVLSPLVLQVTLRWPFALRMLVTLALLAPLGWQLGQALPLGVRAINLSMPKLVPWAWGLNGATSVMASVLGVAIGMSIGFAASLAVATGCYVVAIVLMPALLARR